MNKKKVKRLSALLLMMVMLTGVVAPVNAADMRAASNGYKSTTITYNGKTYTISIGIGGLNSHEVCTSVSCPVGGITIKIGAVTAKFDTYNFGYNTNTGSSKTVIASANASITNPFTAVSYYCRCSYGTSQVIQVLSASGSATFQQINAGSNVKITATYSI